MFLLMLIRVVTFKGIGVITNGVWEVENVATGVMLGVTGTVLCQTSMYRDELEVELVTFTKNS
jgi:hypothetical protein